MRVGVILTRAQPIHLGHVDVIRQALDENDKVLLIIGSANKSGTERNPFPLDLRKTLVLGAIRELHLSHDDKDRISVETLNDWSTETSYQFAKEWGSFMYYNIVNWIGQKEFNFYYNDNVSIIESWFTDDIRPRISVINSIRIGDISSTKVRQAIIDEDYPYLNKVLCSTSFKYVNYMKKLLLECDSSDFIMN